MTNHLNLCIPSTSLPFNMTKMGYVPCFSAVFCKNRRYLVEKRAMGVIRLERCKHSSDFLAISELETPACSYLQTPLESPVGRANLFV